MSAIVHDRHTASPIFQEGALHNNFHQGSFHGPIHRVRGQDSWMIHSMLERFVEASNLEKQQNNRWRQFDLQVNMHYAHTVFFYAYMRASILDSRSSPPCNNLCIKSSAPSADWNKMDVALGGWFVKYTATNYLQGTLHRKKNNNKKHSQGKELECLLGRIRLLWEVVDRYRAELYGCGVACPSEGTH